MPYFGSTLFVASLVTLFLVSLGGGVLLAAAVAPRAVEAIASAEARRPVGSVLLGLPILTLLMGLVAILLQGHPAARVLGAAVGVVGATALLVGLAGTARRLGTTLAPDATPAGRILRGALVVELAALLPFFGWLVVLPLALAAGLGGAVIAIGDRARAPAEPSRSPALGTFFPGSTEAHPIGGGGDHAAR